MAPSSPLGLVGKLPREIRDKIYFEALGHVCITHQGTIVDMDKREPLSILAVGRQISWEASQSLSSRTTLHFDGDVESSFAERHTKVANISVTFDANMGMIFEDDEEDKMERYSKILPRLEAEAAKSGHAPYWINLLDGFTGAQRVREEARLHFRPIGVDHPAFSWDEEHPPLVCSQSLRHSIKQLVGFRKVAMVLEFVVKAGDISMEAYGGCGRIRDQTIRSYVQLMADMNNAESFDDQDKDHFKKLTTEVGQDFETYLGPFTKSFLDRANGDFAGIITYHLQESDTIREKAAMAGEKFSQMVKAMTESSLG